MCSFFTFPLLNKKGYFMIIKTNGSILKAINEFRKYTCVNYSKLENFFSFQDEVEKIILTERETCHRVSLWLKF